mgnify:CR=1 FL=1
MTEPKVLESSKRSWASAAAAQRFHEAHRYTEVTAGETTNSLSYWLRVDRFYVAMDQIRTRSQTIDDAQPVEEIIAELVRAAEDTLKEQEL